MPEPTAARSGKGSLREWLARGALLVGAPLAFFLLLELALRLLGIGHPTSFFLKRTVNGKPVLVQNDQFGWRFFGRELSRTPMRLRIPVTKPPDTCRIFVLGESAAYGDPQPDFGLPRMLQVLLGERYRGIRFEVVNAAMTAINSHAILPIAKECAEHDGDLWVIYMGNNEVVGPFGSGTIFGPKSPPLALIRGSLALKTTRTGQLLDELISRMRTPDTTPQEWGGLTMFLQNQVRSADPHMQRVYSHFARNLSDMLDSAVAHGTKAIVCTVGSNLRDCAPFGSLHQPGLSTDKLAEWERLWKLGVEAQDSGSAETALRNFEAAAAIDGQFAQLHFRRALALAALGRLEEARRAFTLARDSDTLRFRTDTRLNELIKQSSANRESQGIYFVDTEKLLAQHSPEQVPGRDLFYEHVHFTFAGNYWLARNIAEQAAKAVPLLSRQPISIRDWPSAEDCARRLGWNDWDHYETLRLVLARINDPPFTGQLTHGQAVDRLRRETESLLPALSPEQLPHAAARYRTALELAPDDWVLYAGQARLLKKMGDFRGAGEAVRQVIDLVGASSELHVQLGMLLQEQGQTEGAIKRFQAALNLDPGQVNALTGLGLAFAQQTNYSAAISSYKEAIRLKPHSIDAHLNLAIALKALGKNEEAAEHFRLGMVRKPVNAEGLTLLGKVCMEQGWTREALTNFLAAVRLDPTDANARFCLGLAQVAAGNRADAELTFAEAVRLNPNFAEAHVGLGIELGRRGMDAEALDHFAAAARLKPDFLQARLNLGIALFRQQRYEEALREFREALRLDPANPTAKKYIENAPGGG